jgi:hypothetical protein
MSVVTLQQLNDQVSNLLGKKEYSSIALALAGSLSNLTVLVCSVPGEEDRKKLALFVAGVVAMQAKALAAMGGYVEEEDDASVRPSKSDGGDRGKPVGKGVTGKA